VVELRGKQVIAALDRGQRLHRQFTHRRAFRREHRPRVLPDPKQAVSPGSTHRTEGPARRTLREQQGLTRERAYPPI
jgi:hypothetical protein